MSAHRTFSLDRLLIAVACGIFAFIFFKNAWVADDAYISFRSVEQFFAGNGLRWNIDERVQVYTSPLWFLLLCVTRVVSDNLFLDVIFLSFAACAVMLFFSFKVIRDAKVFLVFILVLTCIWAVMDFSTSGLENPLLYALLAAYLYFYLAFFDSDKKSLCFNGLCCVLGLMAITRHDVATLVFFPSLYIVWSYYRQYGFLKLLRGGVWVMTPLLLWSLFSTLYYGMPFPNTAYAKMLHGVPRQELIDFGLLYLSVSLRFDLFAVLALCLLLVRVLIKRELPLVFLLLGVLNNFAYVVYVGGDFMLGRFVSTAVFVATLAFFSKGLFAEHEEGATKKVLLGGLAALVGLGTLTMSVPLKLKADSGFDISLGQRHYSWQGILNERNFYFKTNSLWAYWHRDETKPFPDHKWCHKGREAGLSNKNAAEFGGIGMYGYCAGLELIIIDNLALADPFLSRLPKAPEREWRAGHFHRALPAGYRESRLSGVNMIENAEKRKLWNDINLLVSSDELFAKERLQAIYRVNSGHYNDKFMD